MLIEEKQTQLALLCRLDAPRVVPPRLVAACKTYREVVQLCWALRLVRNMTRAMLAERTGLYAPHITCYLNDNVPKNRRRDLPPWATRSFELACDNTAISQWHAMNSKLTVVEEMLAMKVSV